MRRRTFITTVTAGTLIAGCVGDVSNPSDPDPEPPDDVEYYVGDIVPGDGLNFKLNNAERTTDVDTHHDLDRGEEFLLVDVTAKNVSEERYTPIPNLLSSTVKDIDGDVYDSISGPDTIISSELLPGELDSGIIPFIVPNDAGGLYLRLDRDYALPAELDDYRVAVEIESDDPGELTQDIPSEYIHAVGDIAEYNGYEITVEEANATTELDMYTETEDGKEFITVTFSTEGDGGSSESRARHLTDHRGYNYTRDIDATDAARDAHNTDQVFQVPEGTSPVYWVYKAGSRGIEGKQVFEVH